jgi:hypothetical protein
MSEGSFGGDEGADGSELAAGVGAPGGHAGSNARAKRSMTTDKPCGTRVSLGARRDATHECRESPPEERHRLAAEVHGIIRRREKPGRRVFE